MSVLDKNTYLYSREPWQVFTQQIVTSKLILLRCSQLVDDIASHERSEIRSKPAAYSRVLALVGGYISYLL